MKKIYLASNNAHKAKEIQAILKNYTIITLSEAGITLNTIEDGKDFRENAFKKAHELYEIVKQPCLADDSGLEVDVINGKPGLYSARYAGKNATDKENYEKLLKVLENQSNRNAQFNCTLCFINNETVHYFEGLFKGNIGKIPEGIKGFGYDPVFYPTNSKHSIATFSPQEKNRISHRYLALEKLKKFLVKND